MKSTWVVRLWGWVLVVVAGAIPGTGHTQNIDQAIQAYNSKDFPTAAFLFFDVKENSSDPEARLKAEYYLGRALYRAGFILPAYQFYGEVFNAGESHPYFLKATEGLLDVAREIRDDTLIPEIINRGYAPAFARLKADDLNTINYMIGMIEQRRGNFVEAKKFLEAVRRDSDFYPRARYLLAIMAVKAATEQGDSEYEDAIEYFQTIETKLAEATTDDDRKLYRLALLGQARAYFSQGDFATSVEYYEKIPRFSEDWYDAMFESGWAYFQNARFGRALGMVHSIQSPYFDDRYRAESFVLKATVYFQMCHFDRARVALDSFFELYEPMSEQLKPWLEGDQTDPEMVELIVQANPTFPSEIRLQISGNRRFQKFLAQVQRVDAELARARTDFPDGAFKNQMLALLEVQREQRVALTGKLVRDQLRREAVFLDDFLGQARIIQLETTTAERKMLDAGKDITKGPRAKGPRPIIPDATYQYWAFLGEYWIDELGYYEHSIKDECVPEVFQ